MFSDLLWFVVPGLGLPVLIGPGGLGMMIPKGEWSLGGSWVVWVRVVLRCSCPMFCCWVFGVSSGGGFVGDGGGDLVGVGEYWKIQLKIYDVYLWLPIHRVTGIPFKRRDYFGLKSN